MNKLFESLDINDEMKTQLSEAFDKAVMVKSVELMDEHVASKVAEAKELLEEEYAEKVENLEDTLDGYMTSVVEEFIATNTPVYEAEIKDEKATKLLEMFDKMMIIAGIEMSDIQEARSERDIKEDANSLENQIARLDARLSEKENDLAEARKEANKFLKDGIIAEVSKDLSIVEADKFEKLAGMVTFSRDKKYIDALDTIKASIVESRVEGSSFNESVKLPEGSFKSKAVDAKAAVDYSRYV